MSEKRIKLDPTKRVLFLTKDLELIRRQLHQGLNLKMADLRQEDLLDDINTDVMTPAWVCFHHDPKEIAKRAYAGLLHQGERIFQDGDLMNGNFQAIVSGERKGTGSSRETAAQCEKFCGIHLVFAASFAPIHKRNNINLGQLMGSYELLRRLQGGEEIPLNEFLKVHDSFSKKILAAGGLFPFLRLNSAEENHPNPKSNMALSPLTMAQKIMAKKIIGPMDSLLKQESFVAQVDSGYSHEFTSAQVHQFLRQEYGESYRIHCPDKFAAFEDHLIYADEVKKFAPHFSLIQELRRQQRAFIAHTNVRDYSAKNGISPGICHEVARQDFVMPGDFIQATDSHTCMGGALNAFAFGVGATEYAGLLATGLTVVNVPHSVRFELIGRLNENCTAKDVMLFILRHYSKKAITLDKVIEFGGPGLATLSIDERATLCNMATECGAKTGICEPDELLISWLHEHRAGLEKGHIRKFCTWPDKDCAYEGGIYEIDLASITPMVARPPDPMNGELIADLGDIAIDIAYGGSCTAGKFADIDMYALVTQQAIKNKMTLNSGVKFYIQYGSKKVEEYARKKGYHDLFLQANIKVIPPGCGACIGCGPGVSEHKSQVSISAINRNFQGRSGPGDLYLASPLTVAASAFAGKITAFTPDGSSRGQFNAELF